MTQMHTLSVVIPTYNRGGILLDAINLLLNQDHLADEILVIDQTSYQKNDAVVAALTALVNKNKIIWIRLDAPSIPIAMNKGLQAAKSSYVLFIDDDVEFKSDFIHQHRKAINSEKASAYIGQILQPDEAVTIRDDDYYSKFQLVCDLSFPFSSNKPAEIYNCMAGNLVVDRQAAIQCGGFDQQFSGAAYRFETEFCRRMIAYTNKPFHFNPQASLNHLKIATGGTRAAVSDFLTSMSPVHSQGDYYFAMRCGKKKYEIMSYVLRRFFGCLKKRFYLHKPWWIPIRLVGEIRGLYKACVMFKQGPRLINEVE